MLSVQTDYLVDLIQESDFKSIPCTCNNKKRMERETGCAY